MADTEDQEFDEAFKGFGDDPAPVTPPTDPGTPPATPGAAAEPPKADPPATPPADPPKPTEEPKKDDEPATPPETPPAPTDEKKPEDPAKPPETPETPPAPEPSQPLTKEDVESVVSNLLNTERTSGKELETTANEVLEKYYPEGLSNVLVDEKSGRELRTPQDVVEASGGNMSTEEAAQWLMNEQFKLDKTVDNIKSQAKEIAETTLNFKRDSMAVLQKYDPLFKWQPHLQKKAYDLLMRQVKADEQRGVILSAPDVIDLYDTYLEPYQKAYEFKTNQPATNPTAPPTPPPATPSAEDRMDVSGDGGPGGPSDDPNDFPQQVVKELAREL